MFTIKEEALTPPEPREAIGPVPYESAELGEALSQVEKAERQARDRQRELELARLRQVQAFD